MNDLQYRQLVVVLMVVTIIVMILISKGVL